MVRSVAANQREGADAGSSGEVRSRRTNPEVGESFRGIERYLASALIEQVGATQPGVTRSLASPSTFELQPAQRDAVKHALRQACETRSNSDDLTRVLDVGIWLETRLLT